MTKFCIALFFVLTVQNSFAQTPIIYDYDVAGNRVSRKPSTPLPVTLISFTAVKEEHTALLNWQTSSETNADRFDVERSQDGRKWINIGEITANGDKKTNSMYSFLDKNPFDGENLYRLKMVDLASDRKDGAFSYSRIQSLIFEGVIVFYPNPVKDRLHISGSVNGKIDLLSSMGQVVYSAVNIPREGIDMSLLSAGVYLIRIFHDSGSQIIKKVVKQ